MEDQIFENEISKTYELNGKQLFWGRPFSRVDVFYRTIGLIIKFLIRAFCITAGIIGLLALVNHFWLLQQAQISIFNIESWLPENTIVPGQQPYLLYCWWSLIFDMYLFYSFGLEARKNNKVFKKHFVLQEKTKLSARLKRINIAEAFSSETLRLLDRAYLSSLSQNKNFDYLRIFYFLLQSKTNKIVFGRLAVSVKQISVSIARLMKEENFDNQKEVSAEIHKSLLKAYLYAYEENRQKVEPLDLLRSVSSLSPVILDLLQEHKIDQARLDNAVKWILINRQLLAKYKHYKRQAHYKPKGVMDRAMTALATPVLDAFSQDLTSLARGGYLGLCIGRDKEFAELFNVIEGGRESVVLVGLPGVGKDAVINGLANAMVAEEVPKSLRDKRLVSLSIAKLVAAASRDNSLENLLMTVMKEVRRAGNVILHIEDIHNLVGVTSVGTENVELSEIFAEFLKDKNIIGITTTTPADYTRYLENHPLGQALLKINLSEPDDNTAIQMVESKVGFLEGRHQIFFSYNALETAVKLSRRFIPEHYLPEKAMNLLEEVAAFVRDGKGKNKMVTDQDVAEVISHKTNIPLTSITQAETEKLLNLEERIHQRMVNQEEAVNYVASALRRARAELRDEKRPISNLLFLGPTGVGKTELAKTLASIYFGSEESMIRIDMSEYQQPESISRLIGSRESSTEASGGILTEAVRRKPFALVLFDEIEKAHPDILNLFLQMMDDGRLTDAAGRTVDFSQTIIIATSNAGTQFLQDSLRAGRTLEDIKNQLIQTELKQYFRPEFLNRFDGLVVFKPLSKEHIFQIAGLMLNKVKKRLTDKGIYLEVTDEAQQQLAEAGYDPAFGARPLRRVIQEKVDNALANYLLQGKIGRRDKVILETMDSLRVEKARRY